MKLQQLSPKIGNLKGFKGADNRDIFIEQDTMVEDNKERRVTLFVRHELLKQYTAGIMIPPSIHVVEGRIKVFRF